MTVCLMSEEDNDYDINIDEEEVAEPQPTLADRVKQLYGKIFFYGIAVPKRGKKKLIDYDMPRRKGLDSLFFTRSELIAMNGVDRGSKAAAAARTKGSRPKGRQPDDRKALTAEALQSRIDRVSKTLSDLQDDVEMIDAMLLTCPANDDEAKEIFAANANDFDGAVTRTGLTVERDRLLETIAALKIEYVNLIAESNS